MDSERGSPPQRRCSRRHCRRRAGSPEGRKRRFADKMEREDEDATQERRLFRRALSKGAQRVRILANRHSAHRKLQYISKLERSVTSFQVSYLLRHII
ncbi:hypothetical protein HN51_012355 [Arachis hypogaea]